MKKLKCLIRKSDGCVSNIELFLVYFSGDAPQTLNKSSIWLCHNLVGNESVHLSIVEM